MTADFDGDGRDEVVTGDRGDGRSLYLWSASDAAGRSWTRQVLDAGDMSPSGCVAEDLDGDALVDLVCIGGGSRNLKWYENIADR